MAVTTSHSKQQRVLQLIRITAPARNKNVFMIPLKENVFVISVSNIRLVKATINML